MFLSKRSGISDVRVLKDMQGLCHIWGGDIAARDPMNLRDHEMVWVDVDDLLDTDDHKDWEDSQQAFRMKMAAVQGMGAARARNIQFSRSQIDKIASWMDRTGWMNGQKTSNGDSTKTMSCLGIHMPCRFTCVTGLDAELEEDDERLKKGRDCNYLEPDLESMANGVCVPQGTIKPGVGRVLLHMSNPFKADQILEAGKRIATIGELGLVSAEGLKKKELPNRPKKVLEKHRDTKELGHWSHFEEVHWKNKRILLNDSLNIGASALQEEVRKWAEKRRPKELVALQYLKDGEVMLKPWKDAGYRVSRLTFPEPEQGGSHTSAKRRPKRRAAVTDLELWVIEKEFAWENEDERHELSFGGSMLYDS